MKPVLQAHYLALAMGLTSLALLNSGGALSHPSSRSFNPILLTQRPSVGNPDARRGSVGKGICPDVTPPLTALMPKPDATGVGGKTIAAHPTLWFYVPYTESQGFLGTLSLEDEQGNSVYRTALRFPKTAGVMGVRVPPTIPALEVNKRYNWSFQVACADVPIKVAGWIQRVAPSPKLTQQLQAAKQVQQRAAVFLSNDIWFDGLTLFAEERKTGRQKASVTDAWGKLMNDIELGDIAPEPMSP
ncbi:MAG: DUF928 domain-containing protein [Leptolyngbyaceae cyanobacterium bins.349]|nr:DUF928 domain-containing protein [Leptolyngbyaceae cyanobacterium bins.349]